MLVANAEGWFALGGALGGAAIGAVASFGGAAYVEWRKDRRRTLAVVRVLVEELKRAVNKANLIGDMGLWVPPEQTSGLKVWREQRGQIAADLRRNEWTTVANAFMALETLDDYCRRAYDRSIPGATATLGDDRPVLKGIQDTINWGIKPLSDVADRKRRLFR